MPVRSRGCRCHLGNEPVPSFPLHGEIPPNVSWRVPGRAAIFLPAFRRVVGVSVRSKRSECDVGQCRVCHDPRRQKTRCKTSSRRLIGHPRPKHILRNCPFVTPLLPWLHSFRLASCCSPSIFSSVGAFALSRTSKDAALVMTLEPGNYTAQVRSDTAGEVLLEVYFVD